jgi:hypothetical protein
MAISAAASLMPGKMAISTGMRDALTEYSIHR